MLSSYFSPGQQATLALAFAFGLGAMVLHIRGQARWALASLTCAALVLRLFAAFLDPYLNYWDECFHALVAKNMIAHPLKPMLHTEGAMPVTTLWAMQHIWLHKPPFFLWQIALSLKLFGLHPWAVRIPSALWMTALVPVVYRMAQLMANERIAFAAALFTCFAYFPQELTAGAINTDHNDAIFIVAVACSWWALLEFFDAPNRKWALLIGLFSACAVLTKWYVGLCVFLPWGLILMGQHFEGKKVRMFLLALVPVLLICGSWIFYIVARFPLEAAFEWGFKSKHFSEAIDGHSGPWTFHFDVIAQLIPPFTWWLVLPALVWTAWSIKRPDHRIFLVSLIISVHLFFAFAQTKMLSYTMVLFPLYMIAIANAVIRILDHFIMERARALAAAICMILLSGSMLNIERTQADHTDDPSPVADHQWRQQQLGTIPVLDHLSHYVRDPARTAIFNIPALHHIQFMFNTGAEAWDRMPTDDVIARLHAKGYTVFAVQDGVPLSSFPQGVIVIPDSVILFPRVGRL